MLHTVWAFHIFVKVVIFHKCSVHGIYAIPNHVHQNLLASPFQAIHIMHFRTAYLGWYYNIVLLSPFLIHYLWSPMYKKISIQNVIKPHIAQSVTSSTHNTLYMFKCSYTSHNMLQTIMSIITYEIIASDLWEICCSITLKDKPNQLQFFTSFYSYL